MLLALRLVLAVVFAVAGVAKLLDRDGSAAAARGFGVPARLAPVFGVVLPVVELVVAGLLVPAATVAVGAAAAVALLAAFCVAIGAAMARGEAPDCHCFGQLHSAEAGPATLVRNGVLLAAAGGVLAGALSATPASTLGWLDGSTGTERAAVAVAAVAVLVAVGALALAWQLLQAHGRLLLRVDALEAGGAAVAAPRPLLPAPGFALDTADGPRRTLAELLGGGRPALLVFTDPSCGPCQALAPSLTAWQGDADRPLIVPVSAGDAGSVRAEAERHGLADVLLDPGGATAEAYGRNGTPSAALVHQDGRWDGTLAEGEDAIHVLAAPQGRPAPVLHLTHVGGGPAALGIGDAVPEALAGDGPALVLSWDPSCGFCRQAVEPLRDAVAEAGVTRLVLLARGDLEATRALDPPGAIVSDADGALARSLDAEATPVGVLVDDGRVVSAPAIGADAAIALLRGGVAV